MIELDYKWRFGAFCIRIARWLPLRLAIWLLAFALHRLRSQYRINRGPWESYKSAAHVKAVNLYAGVPID